MTERPDALPEAPTAGWKQSRLLRRYLPLLVIVGIGVWLLRSQPHQTVFVYELDGRRQGLEALRVDLYALPARQLARHAEFRYSPSRPPPSEQEQKLKLAKGSYELEAAFDYGTRVEKVSRTIVFDREERVTIRF